MGPGVLQSVVTQGSGELHSPGGFEPEPDGRLRSAQALRLAGFQPGGPFAAHELFATNWVRAGSNLNQTCSLRCARMIGNEPARITLTRNAIALRFDGSGRDIFPPCTIPSHPGSRAPAGLAGFRDYHEHESHRPRTNRTP
jgi:hypothetical protein